MKFQTAALLLLAASIEGFSPVANSARSSALKAEGLNVDLPSIESQVSSRFARYLIAENSLSKLWSGRDDRKANEFLSSLSCLLPSLFVVPYIRLFPRIL